MKKQNEIEDLRSVIDGPNHIPFSFDNLIEMMTREQESNDNEIRLLQQIVSSSEAAESER